MKKIILILCTCAILITGCKEDKLIADASHTSYELSEITQGYNNNSVVEGIIINTGDSTMYDVIISCVIIENGYEFVGFGAINENEISAGDSARFYVSMPNGTVHINKADKILYKVYFD